MLTREQIENEDPQVYDIENALFDYDNGNFEFLWNYCTTNIIEASIINGQFKQAKEQCRQYGLDYESAYNHIKGNK